MGRLHVAGGGFQDLLVLAQHHVQDKVNAADVPCLFNVHAQRISLQPSGAGVVPDHHGVVGLDGRSGGAAGHDGLGAAGVAREVVVLHIAEADADIRLRHRAGDVHRSTRPGDAQRHAVLRVAVHAADLLPGPLAGKLALLGLGLVPVAAQGKDQGDILRPHAPGIELVQQGGHDLGRGHGAGQVAGDDGNGLAGTDDLPQPGGAHRLPQGAADLFLLRGDGRGLIGPQHSPQISVRDLHGLDAGAESEFQLHFVSFLFRTLRAASSMWAAVRPKRSCR